MKKFLLGLLIVLAGCSLFDPILPEPMKGTYRFNEETEGNLSLVDDAMRDLVYQQFVEDFKLSKDPYYLYRSITVLINKELGLPQDFIPANLIKTDLPVSPGCYYSFIREDVHDALEAMFEAALHDGFELWFHSGYRSFAAQKMIYENYVKRYGQAKTDIMSAKPGHSEHQSGLAVDITSSSSTGTFAVKFGDSKEGDWVAQHAHEFGFIVRYPEDKTAITGYMYEPWHLRYVGVQLAAKLFNSGKVLEELNV